jgi:putative membrane protein
MIHYDPHKWLDHFFDIRGSMVRQISLRVTVCVIWSALVVVAYAQGVTRLAIPSTLHTMVGLALGLLLVFRTNSSYDRFWEGRKLWGGIVNETRNLVRGALVHLDSDPELLERLTRWTAMFPHAAMNTLRGVKDLSSAESVAPPAEIALLQEAQHPALGVASRMTECLREAHRKGLVSDIVLTSLDQNVQLLVDYLGGCERIRKTPLPFAYVVHLRRALVIYCFTLPFALVETFGWTTVLDVLLVAYTFFGIEEIGVQIEGPFGFDENDLPLEEICETIERNLFALAGLEKGAREALPEGL